MTITLNGTTGISNDGGYTGDGVSFADTTPANTLVTTTGGNVGIGTSSPNVRLFVGGTNAKFKIDDTTNGQISIEHDASTNNIFSGNSGFSAWRNLQIAASNIIFSSNGTTERMRIDSSGNLLVGTTSVQQSSQLTVAGYIATNGITSHAGTGGAYGTNRFNINWTGSPQLWIDTTNVGTIQLASDYRIKRNIETQTAPALERVMALRPVTYQMADYGDLFKAGDAIKEGFIAHEVQEVIPSGAEGVKDDPNQIQSLRVDAILAVAVKAIQEQQAIITDLKAELDTVKAEVTALKGTA